MARKGKRAPRPVQVEPHPSHFGAVACRSCKVEQASVRVRCERTRRVVGNYCAICLEAALARLRGA